MEALSLQQLFFYFIFYFLFFSEYRCLEALSAAASVWVEEEDDGEGSGPDDEVRADEPPEDLNSDECVRVCVCVYVCICVCIYIYTHTHIHIHTYIHT